MEIPYQIPAADDPATGQRQSEILHTVIGISIENGDPVNLPVVPAGLPNSN